MKGDAVNCGVCRQIVDMTCANCSASRIAALTSELAEARRQLGEADAKFEALLDGEYARRWIGGVYTCRRLGPNGSDAALVDANGDGFTWRACGLGFTAPGGRVATMDEGKAACDAALAKEKWWLEGGPHGAGEAK